MVNGVLCNGRNRIVREGNRNGDAGDGEQENGICLENRNGGRGGGRRGTGERDLPGEQEPEDEARGDKVQENRIGLENMKLHKV